MPYWDSNNYEGRYLRLSISESTDTINNKSTLYWTLTSTGGAVNYYTIDETTVTINGTQVYYKARTAWSSKEFPAAKGSVSGSIDVYHNSDGSKSISVGFSTRVYVYGPIDYGGSMNLTKLDRAAPSVSLSTSNVSVSSVAISATSSTYADRWYYSTNGGSSWALFNSSNTASTSHTITGLAANTSYSIRVKARKSSNYVEGTSGTSSIKTLGASVINSANTITADNATVNIVMSLTVYDSSFTHELSIKKGSTTILTITGISASAGSSSKTVTLTSAQRTTLLNAMSSIKSFSGTLSLVTKSGGATIGSASEKSATVQTTSANSAPSFGGFTFQDNNTTASGVTGNNQILIQGYSTLQIICNTATAKNGASISAYSAVCSDVSKSGAGTTLNMGAIGKSGNQIITVTVTDSRGYSVTSSRTVTVLSYSNPKISSYRLRRVNEVDDLIQLSFSGTLSTITVSSVNKNSLLYVRYRYKKTNDSSYSSYYSILSSVTATSTSFSFSNMELRTLDANFSWNFQIQVRDQLNSLSSFDLDLILPQGMPLISMRPKKVGINTQNPQEALDVVGNIRMNGHYVVGFVRALVEGDSFNNIRNAGVYFYPNNPSLSYAPSTAGFLEVITAEYAGTQYTQQKFVAIASGNLCYLRTYNGSTWTSWRQF